MINKAKVVEQVCSLELQLKETEVNIQSIEVHKCTIEIQAQPNSKRHSQSLKTKQSIKVALWKSKPLTTEIKDWSPEVQIGDD